MKTYILDRGWNSNKRITVEDDVDIMVNMPYDGNDRCYDVKFVKVGGRTENYIMGFTHVESFYIEDSDIMEMKEEEVDITGAVKEVKATKQVWTAI